MSSPVRRLSPHHHFLIALLPIVGLVGIGCQEDSSLSTAETTGQVRWQGKPLPNATVIFEPDASHGSTGPIAVGITDGDGRYALKTASVHDGAVIGPHRVAITLNTNPYEEQPAETIPAKYADSATSGLTTRVTGDPKINVFDFDLQ